MERERKRKIGPQTRERSSNVVQIDTALQARVRKLCVTVGTIGGAMRALAVSEQTMDALRFGGGIRRDVLERVAKALDTLMPVSS